MPEPKRCSCCEKHTLRAQEEKKKLLNRLRRIEGQVRGLQVPRPLRSSMARTGFATTAGIRKARSSRCPSSSA